MFCLIKLVCNSKKITIYKKRKKKFFLKIRENSSPETEKSFYSEKSPKASYFIVKL